MIVDVGECVDLAEPRGAARVLRGAGRGCAQRAPSRRGCGGRPQQRVSTAPADFGSAAKRREDEANASCLRRLIAKVVELRETVPNAYLITLDNGQVWRQTQPKYDYSLRPGSDVRIYSSRWRSFRLTSPQLSGYIQVERVR